MAILVVIQKGASGVPAQFILEKAGFLRNIREFTFAFVTIKSILPVVTDK